MREIYLNSGTHSLCPPEILEAVSRYQRDYERNPTERLMVAYPRLWQSQTRLARFLGADPRDLFLRTNVTHAMNDFIMGVELPSGSEILASDLEYGAVANTCRLRAERDGLKYREFHTPLTGDAATLKDAVLAAIQPATKLLVLSHVATGTGHVFPIAEIARETRRRGVLLAVDGAHAVGALNVDFAELSAVDFYGGNLHKWMMGPKGTAFGWVARERQPLLTPLMGGWPTFDTPDYYGEFGGGSRFAERHALLGCHDYAPFFALTDMLDLWDRKGADHVRARIFELQNFAEDQMARLGWTKLSPTRGPLRGPLLAYRLPEAFQKRTGHAILTDLWNKKCLQLNVPLVQKSTWAARLSPHIYNTEDEIVEAVRRIEEYFR